MAKREEEPYLSAKSTYDAVTRIWSGPKVPLPFASDCSVGAAVLAALQRDPENIAQICHHNGKQYTNGEIAMLAIRVAQHFAEMQVPQGTVIGICAKNSDYIAPLFYGALLAGLTISSCDPYFEPGNIPNYFACIKPKLMFCDADTYSVIQEYLKAANVECDTYITYDHIAGVSELTEFLRETGSEHDYIPPRLQQGQYQTALIVCSSGSVGFPKRICVSHEMLLNNSFLMMERGDIFLYFPTIDWITSSIWNTFSPIKGGTRVISVNGFSPEAFCAIVEKYGVTMLFTPSSHLSVLAAYEPMKHHDLTSLRRIIAGGAALPLPKVEKLRSHIPNAMFIAIYGTSEAGGVIATGEFTENFNNGPLWNNFDIKIIDTKGLSLEPGQIGEVCFRTAFKWPGYYDNPRATAEALDIEGWIHTGDLGYINAEGNLYILDRINDTLQYKNNKFFPTEIEGVLNKLPGVAEVCVCGLPNEVAGYLPAAAIVKTTDSNLSEPDVFDFVAKQMDDFNQLRGGVYFLERLPQTPSGKNIRRRVVEICMKSQQNKSNAHSEINESK